MINMDFDKPKVYGDTSITDGLVTLESVLLARSGALARLHLDLVLTKHLEILWCCCSIIANWIWNGGSEGKALMAFSSAACVLYSPPVRFNFWAALYSLLLSLSLLFISPVFALSCCRCISSFSLDSLHTRSCSPSPWSWRHTWPPFQPETVVFLPFQPS